jgi:hypothetical protein
MANRGNPPGARRGADAVAGRVRYVGQTSDMSETYTSCTSCPICRQRIDPEQPDAVLTEKAHDLPGFGQQHDFVWSRVGYAHRSCLTRARGFRAAAEPT